MSFLGKYFIALSLLSTASVKAEFYSNYSVTLEQPTEQSARVELCNMTSRLLLCRVKVEAIVEDQRGHQSERILFTQERILPGKCISVDIETVDTFIELQKHGECS